MTIFLPYIALALWPCFLSLFFRNYREDDLQKKKLLALCFIAIFLFVGLRNYSMGSADSSHYYFMMQRAIDSSSWSSFYNPDGVEIGFQLFLWVLSRICPVSQGLFLVTGLIYASSAVYVIWKEANDCVFAVTLFICLGPFLFELQGMRQAIAMSICMFAYLCAKRGRPLYFLFLVFLAYSFHQTAIVFLLVYPVCRMRYSLRDSVVVALSGFLIIVASSQIAYLGNLIFDRDYSMISSGSGFVTLAIYAICILSHLLFVPKEVRENTAPALLYLSIFNFVIYFMRYTGAHAAERISFYFLFAAVLLLVNSLANLKGANRSQTNSIAGFASLVFVALLVYHLYGSNLVPYILFF